MDVIEGVAARAFDAPYYPEQVSLDEDVQRLNARAACRTIAERLGIHCLTLELSRAAKRRRLE